MVNIHLTTMEAIFGMPCQIKGRKVLTSKVSKVFLKHGKGPIANTICVMF